MVSSTCKNPFRNNIPNQDCPQHLNNLLAHGSLMLQQFAHGVTCSNPAPIKESVRHLSHNPITHHLPQHQTCHHAYYATSNHPSNSTPTQYPVSCETQRSGFRITLTVLPIPALAPFLPIINQAPTLCNIKSNLPKYAPELWTKIDLASNQELTTLQQYLTAATGSLLVVSNMSLNSQKCSSFFWMISMTTTILWTGRGTILGTRRAEGFGLLVALTFLEMYFNHLPENPESTPPHIQGCCNNSTLIQ